MSITKKIAAFSIMLFSLSVNAQNFNLGFGLSFLPKMQVEVSDNVQDYYFPTLGNSGVRHRLVPAEYFFEENLIPVYSIIFSINTKNRLRTNLYLGLNPVSKDIYQIAYTPLQFSFDPEPIASLSSELLFNKWNLEYRLTQKRPLKLSIIGGFSQTVFLTKVLNDDLSRFLYNNFYDDLNQVHYLAEVGFGISYFNFHLSGSYHQTFTDFSDNTYDGLSFWNVSIDIDVLSKTLVKKQ